jgi:precorrin-2/cobalt-factor-2 C20-methyltransferase
VTGPGRLYGVGVGPGDPDLLTVKAARVVSSCPVVAYFRASKRASNARRVVEDQLTPAQTELPLVYPVTTEPIAPALYDTLLIDFYDTSAKRIAERLDEGADVAVLCEGDPFFFGSYTYLHQRLADRYATEVVPGVSSALAGAAALRRPLTARNDVFTVLSGVLPADELATRIADADAAVVMKVGRNLERVRDAVRRAGRLERAFYVERATMPGERLLPLVNADPASAPYFSLVVIPSVAATQR